MTLNPNQLASNQPGIGKTLDRSGQQFMTRIGIIDDPFSLKTDKYINEVRHPLLGSTWDKDLDPNDVNPKDVPENKQFTTKVQKSSEEYAPVNRFTKKVMVRWLDDMGGLAKKPAKKEYQSPSGHTIKGYGKYERALVSMSSSGFYAGRRNDNGEGNGPHVWAGYDFMPPVGSIVIVGFRRGQEPYIINYVQDSGTWLTPRMSQKAQELGPENSIIQNGFDVDVDGPAKTDPFHPTISPLNMGAARMGSYGGSYFLADNDSDNYTKRSRAQKADIGIFHSLGSFMQIHSDTISDKEDFPGDSPDKADNVNQANGTITLQHNSGSYFEIGDGGSMLLSDVQVLKKLDIFPWRPQDKSENSLENEDQVNLGEHRSLEDIRKERINPHGRGNMIFMDGRDKILVQDTALDFISLQNDNITLRNNSQTFLSIEGDKIIARNANGSQFLIDGDQISLKDKNGNHILLDGDTIQIGNSQGTTLRVGKDGLAYSNATGSVINMNGDTMGLQTATGAKIEKIGDTINIVSKDLNITCENYNLVSHETRMHSDKDTYIETGNDLTYKVANNEAHTINKNLNISSDIANITADKRMQLRSRVIREN